MSVREAGVLLLEFLGVVLSFGTIAMWMFILSATA
jgi:hypothetical protein